MKTDEGHRLYASSPAEKVPLDLPGSYGQRQYQAELQDFNKTPTTIDHFDTGDLGPIIDPIGFEHVPVGSADCYRTNMFDSDKTETSKLEQRSLNPTRTDSTIPDNGDRNNSVLGVTSPSATPSSSRECSCITCLDLGSERVWSWTFNHTDYPCRLSDCNFNARPGSQIYCEYTNQLATRKHEKNHFRHEGQFRCIEDRCVYGAKRWSDLKRHYTSKHCLNPKTKFPCPEIGCKYGGNNGFTRKDKLKSHREKVHEKSARPEKCFRVSKSNAQSAA